MKSHRLRERPLTDDHGRVILSTLLMGDTVQPITIWRSVLRINKLSKDVPNYSFGNKKTQEKHLLLVVRCLYSIKSLCHTHLGGRYFQVELDQREQSDLMSMLEVVLALLRLPWVIRAGLWNRWQPWRLCSTTIGVLKPTHADPCRPMPPISSVYRSRR